MEGINIIQENSNKTGNALKHAIFFPTELNTGLICWANWDSQVQRQEKSFHPSGQISLQQDKLWTIWSKPITLPRSNWGHSSAVLPVLAALGNCRDTSQWVGQETYGSIVAACFLHPADVLFALTHSYCNHDCSLHWGTPNGLNHKLEIHHSGYETWDFQAKRSYTWLSKLTFL